MDFKDHFSDRAALYSQFRPTYPDALFEWISTLVPRHEIVWDCATGNGQAAVGLARHFRGVIATDASAKQISMASPHGSIDYRIATAYASGLDDESVDVVTVAQAIHWLDHAQFYSEARRVMRPDAAIVVWGYGDPVIDAADVDAIVHAYNRGTIERYWRPERELILSGLRTIPFPFREVAAPEFIMEREWTLSELAGYMRTWSATAAFAADHGGDPVGVVENALSRVWGKDTHRVRWPLYVRAGYT
jgi:SAM-dependent methyltransferase